MRLMILIACLCLAACASHVVRCDAHLLPINAPTPKSAALPADSSSVVP